DRAQLLLYGSARPDQGLGHAQAAGRPLRAAARHLAGGPVRRPRRLADVRAVRRIHFQRGGAGTAEDSARRLACGPKPGQRGRCDHELSDPRLQPRGSGQVPDRPALGSDSVRLVATRPLTDTQAGSDRIVLPHSERPAASVVIVTSANEALLPGCLGALASAVGDVAIETIIVL